MAEGFTRMREFYLCYCEAGFAELALGDVQMLLAKPDARGSREIAESMSYRILPAARIQNRVSIVEP